MCNSVKLQFSLLTTVRERLEFLVPVQIPV